MIGGVLCFLYSYLNRNYLTLRVHKSSTYFFNRQHVDDYLNFDKTSYS